MSRYRFKNSNDGVELVANVDGEQLVHVQQVEFRCRCSYERAVNLVSALGESEVKDMLEKDNGAELTCGFCNEVYALDEAALLQILAPPILM